MNWILWNKETHSIIDFGAEVTMKEKARHCNHIYQTDAYVAREYTGEVI